MSVIVGTLGFPRIGARRELKTALEANWSGKIDSSALAEAAREIRGANWRLQEAGGVSHVPSNDFSLYDQVLDTSAMVGAIPAAYGWTGGPVSKEAYFAMARGAAGVPALEMTKWFDTNYHYIVPEFSSGQEFTLSSTGPVEAFAEALALNIRTRPVLVGPVTFLKLGKAKGEGVDPLSLLPGLLPVYAEVLRRLAAAGAEWVQIDEPILVLDLSETERAAVRTAYEHLAAAAPGLKLLLASYFGPLGDNLATALSLPVAGLHVDLKRGAGQLGAVLAAAPKDLVLSLGVIDGRNVWRADLSAVLDLLEPVVEWRGAEKIMLAPSCSLLHVPIDLSQEGKLDAELKSWLAFAVQKIAELAVLARALDAGRGAVAAELDASAAAAVSRKSSPRTRDAAVRARLAAVTPAMTARAPYAERRCLQAEKLHLPAYPTTTIGSFPQTPEVRRARADNAKGVMDDAAYEDFLRAETEAAVRWQEEIGIDVLVHGEFERNDMVQYFGEQLAGYAFTQHGWVQSFGSRYVRPPIIFGDVSRPEPMTVAWSAYAQSLTAKPMKGMLTGPVTMLFWSFVRDDIPRSQTCRQIALALRDEVLDLEAAGIGIIQIDEPAIREGLPLRRADWEAYLAWAVECFRLTASGVAPATQIHTHMCYSEFNDIMPSVAAMDADVISIETARSQMELLEAFETFRYPNEIGPGVYDIHSPRVPAVAEMAALLGKAGERLAGDQIWVNPDCGLKTRRWEEVRPALVAMVAAARQLRQRARGGGRGA